MAVFFIVCLIFIVIGILISNQSIEKIKNNVDKVEEYLKEENFSATQSIAFFRGNIEIKVDSKNEKIAVCNYNYGRIMNIVNFKDIVECKVYINNNAVMDTTLKRAIVGGVIAGGIGAGIGALTSKQSNIISKCKIDIITNNLEDSKITIDVVPFQQTQTIGQTELFVNNVNSNDDFELYNQITDFADAVYALCTTIISNNTGTTEEIEEKVNLSIPDEIKKYKELFDIGAITEEEYEQKKQKLLNI